MKRLLAAPELAVPALLGLDADCHTASQALQTLGGTCATSPPKT
ncbi:hypothetical protein [Nonomuraea cypriaca]|nr:hypothetical protein [Nonomuraea cypriaca]